MPPKSSKKKATAPEKDWSDAEVRAKLRTKQQYIDNGIGDKWKDDAPLRAAKRAQAKQAKSWRCTVDVPKQAAEEDRKYDGEGAHEAEEEEAVVPAEAAAGSSVAKPSTSAKRSGSGGGGKAAKAAKGGKGRESGDKPKKNNRKKAAEIQAEAFAREAGKFEARKLAAEDNSKRKKDDLLDAMVEDTEIDPKKAIPINYGTEVREKAC